MASYVINIYMGLDDATCDDLKLLKSPYEACWACLRPIISWSTIYDMSSASWQEDRWLCIRIEKIIHRIISFWSYDVHHTATTFHDWPIATHLSPIATRRPTNHTWWCHQKCDWCRVCPYIWFHARKGRRCKHDSSKTHYLNRILKG